MLRIEKTHTAIRFCNVPYFLIGVNECPMAELQKTLAYKTIVHFNYMYM